MYCKVKHCRFPNSHTTPGHFCGKCGEFGHGIMECGKGYYLTKLELYCEDVLPVSLRCSYRTCGDKNKFHTNQAHYCVSCGDRHFEFDCIRNTNFTKIICPLCRAPNIIENIEITNGESDCSICLDKVSVVLFPLCKHVCACKECFMRLSNVNKIIKNRRTYNINDVISTDLPDFATENALEMMRNEPGKIYVVVRAGADHCWYVRRDEIGDQLYNFLMHGDNWGQYGPDTDDTPYINLFTRNYRHVTEITK